MNRTTHYIRFIVFFLCSIASTIRMNAQTLQNMSQYSYNDFSTLKLPPLDSLFANAQNGPAYQFGEAKSKIEQKLIGKEKKAFLGFFSLRGSYQYGMFGNEATYTDVTTAPYLTYSTHAQNGYTIGAGLNIPLDALFDLKGRVNRQKISYRAAQFEKEERFIEVKKEIIELYTMIVSQINILRLRAEALELTKLQYEIAEKDFINGTITSSELSIEKQRQSTALEAFEKSKFEIAKGLLILEVISCTELIKK